MHALLRGEMFSMMQPDHLLGKRTFSSLLPISLPSQREVHLWYTVPNEIQNPRLINMYQNIISSDEKESILRRNGCEVQKGALLARALVRTTLSRYTNCRVSPDALKFRKNEHGKPELDWQGIQDWNPPSLHFNISHSSSLVACAVAVDLRIGLDVEEKLRSLKNNTISFARRYFTPCEVDYLNSFADCDIQRQELIKMWTIKEAYVKALGRGFSAAPFREFSIRFANSSKEDADNQRIPNLHLPRIAVEPCEDFDYLTTNWRFTLLELAMSHFASICVERDDDCKADVDGEMPALKVWKTVPFAMDELVSGTEAVQPIAGDYP